MKWSLKWSEHCMRENDRLSSQTKPWNRTIVLIKSIQDILKPMLTHV